MFSSRLIRFHWSHLALPQKELRKICPGSGARDVNHLAADWLQRQPKQSASLGRPGREPGTKSRNSGANPICAAHPTWFPRGRFNIGILPNEPNLRKRIRGYRREVAGRDQKILTSEPN